MTPADIIQSIIAFVRDNQHWTIVIVGLLAFGESLAVVSLLLPATAILLGIGALIGAGGVAFWPVWVAAVIGAFLGDWLSYVIGRKLGWRIVQIWPLRRRPDIVMNGHAFFERWGLWSVFIGRFFGPLRAIVPLIAGICAMPPLPFMIGNLLSALLWAFGMLAPGAFGIRWLEGLL
ncbi:MAG: DedA family protein [Pseudomonadota bacterium]